MPSERRFPAAHCPYPPRDSSPAQQAWSLVMRIRTSIGVAAAAAAILAASPLAAQQANTARWEGFYAGVNAGGLWQTTNASIVENNTIGGFNGNGGGFVGGAQV